MQTVEKPPTTPYQRKEFDRYDSPLWFAPVLLERVPISGTVIECCSGGGQISEVLKSYKNIKDVVTNDIDTSTDADFHFDATKPFFWGSLSTITRIDWVITNPPYNFAFEIIRFALAAANKGVAMALRETWLGSAEERLVWLEKNKPTDVISMPRFHFVKNKKAKWGSDSSAVWWIVWRKDLIGAGTNFYFAPQKDIKHFYLNPDKAVQLGTVQSYVSTLP